MFRPPGPPAPGEVTIVLPAWGEVYVRARLANAVASILEQVQPSRVIVVDNASDVPLATPSGVDVVRTSRRCTLGGARNEGLALVSTPWVMFWDADDTLLPGTIAALSRAAGEDDQTVAAVPQIVDDDTGQLHHWPRRSPRALAWSRPLYAATHAISSLFPTIGSLLATDAVRDAGGFPVVEGGDDWALGYSLALRGRVVLSPHRARLYGHHAASVSAGWTARQRRCNAAVVRDRIRSDPATPRLFRHMALLTHAAQLLVIYGLRPVSRHRRARRRS